MIALIIIGFICHATQQQRPTGRLDYGGNPSLHDVHPIDYH